MPATRANAFVVVGILLVIVNFSYEIGPFGNRIRPWSPNHGSSGPISTIIPRSSISPTDIAFANLELFASVFPGNATSEMVNGFTELQSTLIRSLQFFWPLETLSMTLVLDDTVYTNSEERDSMTTTTRSLFHASVAAKVSIQYNSLSNHSLYGRGYLIQQLIMFWADNFTDAEYIGFVDDDTLFSGAVQANDIFDELGRPRVIVTPAKLTPRTWWTDATTFAFQQEPKVYGMNYFPVVINASLLHKMRAHIMLKHPQYSCFDDFYMALIRRNGENLHAIENEFSQFYMMMDFAYQFHRDEYDWHIETHECDRLGFPQEQCLPFSRVSLHAGWFSPNVHQDNYDTKEVRREFVSENLRRGYCYSLPPPPPSTPAQSKLHHQEYEEMAKLDNERCKQYNKSNYNWKGEGHFEEPTAWRNGEVTAGQMRMAHRTKQQSRQLRAWDENELAFLFGSGSQL